MTTSACEACLRQGGSWCFYTLRERSIPDELHYTARTFPHRPDATPNAIRWRRRGAADAGPKTELWFMRRRLETFHDLPVPYDATVDELRRALKPAGPRAWGAFEALASKTCPESLAVLVRAAKEQDDHLRLSPLRAIGGHALGRQAAQAVVDAFTDSSPLVVRTVCGAAAALGLHQAHDHVVRLLDDTDRLTRDAAVRALFRLWSPTDFDPVLRIHRVDQSIDLRRIAAFVLNYHADSTTWRALFDLWVKDPFPRHRTWACDLAACFGGKGVAECIRPLLTDGNGHVRKAADRYFAQCGHRP